MAKCRNYLPPYQIANGESGARCSKQSRSNGHDKWERRGNSDTPSDEVESVHRLLEAKLDNQEGPFPSHVHRQNPGPTGRIELLLLSGRIFGLQSDCNSSRRSREDNNHVSV